jgi:hypothetical protein
MTPCTARRSVKLDWSHSRKPSTRDSPGNRGAWQTDRGAGRRRARRSKSEAETSNSQQSPAKAPASALRELFVDDLRDSHCKPTGTGSIDEKETMMMMRTFRNITHNKIVNQSTLGPTLSWYQLSLEQIFIPLRYLRRRFIFDTNPARHHPITLDNPHQHITTTSLSKFHKFRSTFLYVVSQTRQR